jgi:hypothetical protein
MRGDDSDVRYVLGEIAKPGLGFGPLCVFRDLQDAEDFVMKSLIFGVDYDADNYVIFECEYNISDCESVWTRNLMTTLEHLREKYKSVDLADNLVLTRRIMKG